jgi:hypothetical protein
MLYPLSYEGEKPSLPLAFRHAFIESVRATS